MTHATRPSLLFTLAAAILAVAAAAGSGPSKGKKAQTPKYTVSGHISDMAGSHRATVAATSQGKPRRTATTKSDGTFTLQNMAPGSYTIRPTHRLYTFSPSFRTVAVQDHDREAIDFRAIEIPSRKSKR